MMSNGIYRSAEHRAMVNSSNERLSIATFQGPRQDTEIGPVLGMITPETPALFRPIGYEEYLKTLFARKLEGKSFVDSMKIKQGGEECNPLV
ncbi:hypothetical protein C5167_044684 [Papaver somniferum]|nr:hypothetical protein C5167_044684 [Papaver somniferum]